MYIKPTRGAAIVKRGFHPVFWYAKMDNFSMDGRQPVASRRLAEINNGNRTEWSD